jgi:hypothetical protein
LALDIVLPTHYRPDRLNTTLSGLLLQEFDTSVRLLLVENGNPPVTQHRQIDKLITALRRQNWRVEVHPCNTLGIAAIKQYGMSLVNSTIAVLLDNDVVFTRHDTLLRLEWVLHNYDVAVASPLAFDVDDERPVLNEYAYMYELTVPDEQRVSEGNIALGLCLAIVRDDYESVKHLLCPELPYMEDQILVHFLKKKRGYAFLHDHTIFHAAYAGDHSYYFDDQEVVRFLEAKTAECPEYSSLLTLRRDLKDGAEFSRPIRRLSRCGT